MTVMDIGCGMGLFSIAFFAWLALATHVVLLVPAIRERVQPVR